ncbi:BRCT domain-containing protein [Ochromonadaceae sp. CCMP2298]|nr:BRCT domain-containing protein [Ochromonadaceae sp. CCMP2298]
MAATVPSQAPGKFLVGFVFYLCGIPPHPAPKDVPDEKYTRKVIAVLGGQCSDRLTDSVNCCLVKRVGASGYNAVRQCKAVQQLTPQWLYDCYKKNVLLPFQAYHVKPFHGLVIVCSQVTKDERERAQSTIKEHGGTFGAGLEKDKCTHLVAATPDGQKYNYAKSWGNVQIVTLAWIDECVRQKREFHQGAACLPPFLPSFPLSNFPTFLPSFLPSYLSSYQHTLLLACHI